MKLSSTSLRPKVAVLFLVLIQQRTGECRLCECCLWNRGNKMFCSLPFSNGQWHHWPGQGNSELSVKEQGFYGGFVYELHQSQHRQSDRWIAFQTCGKTCTDELCGCHTLHVILLRYLSTKLLCLTPRVSKLSIFIYKHHKSEIKSSKLAKRTTAHFGVSKMFPSSKTHMFFFFNERINC